MVAYKFVRTVRMGGYFSQSKKVPLDKVARGGFSFGIEVFNVIHSKNRFREITPNRVNFWYSTGRGQITSTIHDDEPEPFTDIDGNKMWIRRSTVIIRNGQAPPSTVRLNMQIASIGTEDNAFCGWAAIRPMHV